MHKVATWSLIAGVIIQVVDAFSPSTLAMIPGVSTVNSMLPGNLNLGDVLVWGGAGYLLYKHGL